MPTAQLTEEALAEMSKADDSLLGTDDGDEESDNRMKSATRGLLQNYNLSGATPGATPFRGGMTPGGLTSRTPVTARTPSRGDYIMREAANILALNNIGTPLAGGENPTLTASDFSGATPKAHVMVTPNVLATPSRLPQGMVTPSGTPFRDKMGINSTASENAAELRAQKKANRAQIQAALLKLPAPQNEYSFVLPEDVEDDEVAEAKVDDDASDVIKREERAKYEQEQLKLRMRSQVLQRDLPRATTLLDSFIHFESKLTEELSKKAEELIRSEIVRIIRHEALEFPTRPSAVKKEDSLWEQFSEQQIRAASDLINSEAKEGMSSFSMEEFSKILANEADNEFVFVPSKSKFVRGVSLTRKDRLESISAQFDTVRGAMTLEASKAKKLESKINVYTMGYQKRAASLLESIRQLSEESGQLSEQLYAYSKLRELESAAMVNRVDANAQEVKRQEERERENQKRYRNLITERQQLLSME